MGLQLFSVQNLSYKDQDQSNNYLISGDDSRVSNVNVPNSIPEFGYLTPSELIDFIATDALGDRLSSKYTKEEVNELLDRIRIMVRNMIQEIRKEYKRKEY